MGKKTIPVMVRQDEEFLALTDDLRRQLPWGEISRARLFRVAVRHLARAFAEGGEYSPSNRRIAAEMEK